MSICIYPGSFDPFTNGHLDILARATQLFDKVIVAVLLNAGKQPCFTIEERLEYIRNVIDHEGILGVEAAAFDGLTVEFARNKGAKAVIQGLRAVSDYEYELQIANINKILAPEIDTVFLMATADHSYLSSSIVKEIGRYGGDIGGFVPAINLKSIKERLLAK